MRYLSFVSQGTEFTELACVSLGTRARLHPRGCWGKPLLGPGRGELDFTEGYCSCRMGREGEASMHVSLAPERQAHAYEGGL